jgi:hypothetical protein
VSHFFFPRTRDLKSRFQGFGERKCLHQRFQQKSTSLRFEWNHRSISSFSTITGVPQIVARSDLEVLGRKNVHTVPIKIHVTPPPIESLGNLNHTLHDGDQLGASAPNLSSKDDNRLT